MNGLYVFFISTQEGGGINGCFGNPKNSDFDYATTAIMVKV
jgi:hypothetical protein